MLQPTQLRRRAESLLAQHADAHRGRVAILQQHGDEADETFSVRVASARERLHRSYLLIAVCALDAIPRAPGVCVIEIPRVMLGLFDRPARYRVCHGGRAAGRSWSFARMLLVRALERPTRILATREYQNSIADSIHTLLSDQIELLGLQAYFEIQATAIYGRNGSEFIFSGIKTNVSKIRSLEGIDICFCEEAATISANSWEVLIPTVRKTGSEFFIAFNADLESDPTYIRFVANPPDNAVVVKSTYLDNPRLPRVLRDELEYLRRVDVDAYSHVWEGFCRSASDAQILKGKYTCETFEAVPKWDGPYFGADWGFSQDQTTLVKAWVHDRVLYVEHEVFGIAVDIDRTPALFDQVPGARQYIVRADSSRPETVSYMQRNGFPKLTAVEKWSGSVEDGVAHLRSYEKIVIHPRCVHALEEARLYSYKVDRLSGDVLPDIVDKNNHVIDALRYALAPLIRRSGAGEWIKFYRAESQKTAETESFDQTAKARASARDVTPSCS